MNWRSARLTAALLAIALGEPRAGLAQEPSPIADVKSILREASALIPMIEAQQQSAVAANIAPEQTRAGDDEASLTSRNSANAPVGGVAYSLAVGGRLPEALQLLAPMPDGQGKGVAYWQVTQGLLKVARYDDALLVARLISKDPKEADRSLGTLMQIYSEQWRAGDRQAAAATWTEALNVVQRSPEIIGDRYAFGFPRFLRMGSPRISTRWALWTSRIEQLRVIARSPRPSSNLNRRTSFDLAHGQPPGWQAISFS